VIASELIDSLHGKDRWIDPDASRRGAGLDRRMPYLSQNTRGIFVDAP
jgi:hypothetical protein